MNRHTLLPLLLLVSSFLAVSCQKNEADIDPRDQYTGIYVFSGSQSLTSINLKSNLGTLTVSSIKSGKVVISKDADVKQIKISLLDYPDLVAVMESNTFTLPFQNILDKTATGYTYYKNYGGNGSFINGKITLNISLGAVTDQALLRNDMSVSGSKQ